MKQLSKDPLILEIKKILSEKILQTGSTAAVQDSDLASLDSIGRLSLMVELENLSESELMSEQLNDKHFSSFTALANYILGVLES